MEQDTKDKKAFSIARMFTSCAGLGWMPIAPGTWGSLPPAIIFAVMCYFGVLPVYIFLAMLVLVIVGSVSCVVAAPVVIELTGKKDPGEVVADELAGQAVAFLAVPFMSADSLAPLLGLVGFFAFRFFDILKPPPCKRLEKLPHGVGILADDLMAGVYAAVVLQVYVYFFGG